MNDKTTLDQSTISDTAAKSNNKEKQKENFDNISPEKKKKRKKKQKVKKMDKDKENSLPIAQSTLINSVIEDAQSENRNKTLDISELPSATEDESSISSINTADLIPTSQTVQHEQKQTTTKTKKMPEEKVSSSFVNYIYSLCKPFSLKCIDF